MGWNTRRSFLALAGGGLLSSGCLSPLQKGQLGVFDAVWSTIDQHYFDPAMNGLDWAAVRRAWRPQARKADSQADLYLNVLAPMLDLFTTSHVEIEPPQMLRLPPGRGFRLPRQKEGKRPVMLGADDETGMGARLTWTGTSFVVEAVVPQRPAYRAGLRPGQNVRLAGLSLPATDRKIALVDARSDRIFEVVWTPASSPPSTEWRERDDGFGYLRFNQFDESSIAWVLGTLKSATAPHLVLDLRENSGGLIRELARLLSALLPAGADLGAFETREHTYPMRAADISTRYARPLAVLIGPRTASAAEMSAASLRHHGRARLFGARSAGAVLASQIYDLPDGGKLTIPYADYRTPDGQRIEGVGIDPDVAIGHTPQSAADGSDPAVLAARRWLAST